MVAKSAKFWAKKRQAHARTTRTTNPAFHGLQPQFAHLAAATGASEGGHWRSRHWQWAPKARKATFGRSTSASSREEENGEPTAWRAARGGLRSTHVVAAPKQAEAGTSSRRRNRTGNARGKNELECAGGGEVVEAEGWGARVNRYCRMLDRWFFLSSFFFCCRLLPRTFSVH